MATKVFISYRRDDSKYQARMIYHAFERVLERDGVFMDVDSIPPGTNFRKMLKEWVDQCEILLALIGRGWIDATDPKTGQRRLDNPNDFVRIEIGEALARNIPVVPVLLDGAPMPEAGQLPDDLRELADRQAEYVEFRTFDADVSRLIRKLGLGAALTAFPRGAADAQVQPVGLLMRADGHIKVDAKFVHGAPDGWFKPGAGRTEWFKDHEIGPEMVVVPAGTFIMGSSKSDNEKPVHRVTIRAPFAVGRFAVTFDEWDAAGLWHKPPDERWGRGRHPVINVSWEDATAYANRLTEITGKRYRLPSEAEWEYVARAGTTTAFWWGESISTDLANYDGNYSFGGGPKGDYRRRTVPVDSFEPNPWGLYQVHGNVGEWCEDVWHDSYNGAPADGSPWQGRTWLQFGTGVRVVRGGSWHIHPSDLRSANRTMLAADFRNDLNGFRLVRTVTP